jgi:Tfp pilus assembly protein PilF
MTEVQPDAAAAAPATTSSARATQRRTAGPLNILAPIILLAAGIFAYSNSLGGPFVFDDVVAIVQNPSIRQLWPPHEAMVAPPNNTFAGRPVVNYSFAINYALGGLEVRGYHVTNVAIHLLAALLLFALLRRTFRLPRLRERFGRDADLYAFAIALLWEVHPLLTEVVTYTSTRTEGLMAFFFLLTFYCAARALESARPTRWYAGAVVAAAVGMGCKEVMAAAPPLVYLYDALLVHGSFAAPLRRRRAFYALLAATILIVPALLFGTVAMESKMGQNFGPRAITPYQYALTQSGVIVHYLRLAGWPHPLTIDYLNWPVATSPRTVIVPLAIVIALLAVTAWLLARRRPAALPGAWFFLTLAPTSSFVPLGSEIVAERRMYLPLIALLCVVVPLVHRAAGRSRAALLGVTGILAVALAVTTFWRNGDYATSELIWTDALMKRPDSIRAALELARIYQQEGRLDEAQQMSARAAAMRPDHPATIGSLLIGQGRLVEAEQQLRHALEGSPEHTLVRTNLGLALFRQGKVEHAVAEYNRVLDRDPNFVDAHVYLADALLAQGERSGALAHLETAMRLQPQAVDIRRKYEQVKSGGG